MIALIEDIPDKDILNELVIEFEESVNSVAERHETKIDESHLGTAFAVMMAKAGMRFEREFAKKSEEDDE